MPEPVVEVAFLRRLLDYDHWANHEVLTSLCAAGSPPPRSLKLMAHIIAAEWLWMGRLGHHARTIGIWPELSLAECASDLPMLSDAWNGYLAGLNAGDLSRSIAYVNSKGEHWTNSIADILMHVVMHSAYHRGQIATDLRAQGHAPAYTDFIEGIRRRHIK